MSGILINRNNNNSNPNMKRVLTTLWLVFIAVMINTTYALEAPETQQPQTASPTWIEVGTVIGEVNLTGSGYTYYYNGGNLLKLYVMYLGDKLIYRVQWNGSFYPVKQINDSRSSNAVAEIPRFVYTKGHEADGSAYMKFFTASVHFTVPTW